MAYSTRDDIKSKFPEDRLIELTDDENDGSQVDARIDEAIVRADAKIDSYLRGRYTVPLVLTDPNDLIMIRDISTELAIYELYKRRGDFLLRSDKIKDRYNDAIKDLKNIQAGVQTFAGDGTPNNPKVTRTGCRVYTAERLSQY